jgi:4-carboxymuconolactone decarboxylase
MARLPYIDPQAAPERVRGALALVPPLNVFRMLAHAETVFEPWLRMSGAILTDLELDPRLRELAVLQVARQSGAEYEWVQHVAIGTHAGLTAEQISAVEHGRIHDADCLDERQRSVLALTQAVVAGPHVGDAMFADLRRHLGPREIVELLLTIGNYLALARVMTVLELEVDEAVGDEVVRAARQGGAPPDRRDA